jgi:hypothetical protein
MNKYILIVYTWVKSVYLYWIPDYYHAKEVFKKTNHVLLFAFNNEQKGVKAKEKLLDMGFTNEH